MRSSFRSELTKQQTLRQPFSEHNILALSFEILLVETPNYLVLRQALKCVENVFLKKTVKINMLLKLK